MLGSLTMVLAFIAAPPAAALLRQAPPDTLRPGDLALTRLVIPAGVDTVDVFVVSGNDRRAVNQTNTRLEPTVLAGRQSLLFTFVNQSARGIGWDSIWVDRRDFTPIRHDAGGLGSQLHVTREGGRYVGTLTDSGKPQSIETAFAKPLLDFSVVSTLAGYLPLADRYQVWLASYDFARGKEVDVGVEVIARENLGDGAAARPAWKVRLDFGTHTVTAWYDATSHRMVRGSVSLGARGEMQMQARH